MRPHGGDVDRWLEVDARVVVQAVRIDGYQGAYQNVRFIASLEQHGDVVWLHASLSRSGRGMPGFDHLKLVKELTFGPERTAVQIFPPAAKYFSGEGVADRPVLHLWGRLDEPEGWLPDFAESGTL